MEAIDEGLGEFFESDLFQEDEQRGTAEPDGLPEQDDSSSSIDEDDSDKELDEAQQGVQATGMELGPNSGSAKSTTINVILEDEIAAADDEGADAQDEGAKLKRRPFPAKRSAIHARPVAFSLPAHASNYNMGTSVPINIPLLPRWKREEGAASAAPAVAEVPQYAATFIPPHQLSQQNDFLFSVNGASPASQMKRDRLRVRNAILKSTGFLEENVPSFNTIGLQERNRIVGGLSQALNGPS